MQSYHILVEGYARPGDDGTFLASSTSTLIIDDKKKILVDPGTNKDKLLRSLHSLSMEPSDIEIIYLSHYHPDHFYNINLFPEAELCDLEMVWSGDKEIFHSLNQNIEDDLIIPGTKIKILKTPGHSPEHSSLLIETEDQGKVCIAQDLFWWEDGEQKNDSIKSLLEKEDPFASDPEALKISRQKVLQLADWIIPGHGRLFKNPKS